MRLGKRLAKWCRDRATAWYESYLDLDTPLVRDPWWQQEGESDAAFAAFELYKRMQSPRALRTVADELGSSYTLLSRWAKIHDWVERAAAWDRKVDFGAQYNEWEIALAYARYIHGLGGAPVWLGPSNCIDGAITIVDGSQVVTRSDGKEEFKSRTIGTSYLRDPATDELITAIEERGGAAFRER